MESLRRILESLDGTQDRSGSPPLVTARVDARIAMPNLSIEADTSAELALEDGSVRPRDDPAAARARPCPPSASRATTACASPAARSPWPWRRRAASPSRTWAPAAGCGAWRLRSTACAAPATAASAMPARVRDLAEAAARQGADAVALSPVHSLFAADPARYGPYSPSSRLFLNPLYADPAVVFGAGASSPGAMRRAAARSRRRLIDWPAAGAAKFALLRGCSTILSSAILRRNAARRRLRALRARGRRGLARACAVRSAACQAVRATGADWQAGWRHPATRRSRHISRARPSGALPPLPAMARRALLRRRAEGGARRPACASA